MNLVFRATVLCGWLLAIGLVAVGLEAERIRIGHRIHQLLLQRESLVERIRRLEVQYNCMVSPDILERGLPESFERSVRLAAAGQGGGRE